MVVFSKILSRTDTCHRLSVPTKYLKHLPSFKAGHGHHAIVLEAVDESGFVWNFQCSIRKKGHPKPVLSKSWLSFVSSKKLKVGDKIRFSMERNQTTGTYSYKVRAENEIKIFGAILGYAPIVAAPQSPFLSDSK